MSSIQKTCVWCQAEFTAKGPNRTQQKFCCSKCRIKASYERNKPVILAYHKSRYAEDRDYFIQRSSEYYTNNKEKRQEYLRQYHEKRPLYRFQHNLQSWYGMTLTEYQNLFEDQGGVCAICGEPPGETRLHVDHKHDETKAIRGLLCGSCNIMLGLARDNIETLKAAIKYLSKGGGCTGTANE